MKREIIDTALDQLYEQTGIRGQFLPNLKLDGSISLEIDRKKTILTIDVKQELRRHQLFELALFKKRYPNLMVVAKQIFPKIKEELREIGIAYLEANGNIFIKNDHLYLFIDTNKKLNVVKETANRAFTKTGLKVLFHLLNDKELINKTQREIAETVGVGLGNIPQVIDGLKETGYLIKYKKQEYIWEKRKELLDRWINAYATELRPKIFKATYTLRKEWQTINLNTQRTVWGGEPAADKLTHYLRPEKFILYTNEKQNELIKNYHLIPSLNGELEVLEIFWKPQKDIAPAIIVYAELMLIGGKRNIETAHKIFNDYIQPIL
jgi:hypothetical protein